MEIRDLIRFNHEKQLFTGNDRILLAVSGGIDSAVMAEMFHGAGFKFGITHCNFSLRGGESDLDELFVKSMAYRMKVPFYATTFDTPAFALQNGISIQMAARELRYRWFESTRKEHRFDYVATAHHLDDQAETFLINLIRGTGIAGLHGIPLKNGTVIRPMMFAIRMEIEQYALSHHVEYRQDQSNNETKYLRNKIRHEIIPILGSVNPGFVAGLTETIRRIGEFELVGNRALEDLCRNLLSTSGKEVIIDVNRLTAVSPVEPLAWALLSPFGFNETQVANLLTCLGSDHRQLFNSPTHRLVKERGRLTLTPAGPATREKTVTISLFPRQKKISKPIHLRLKRISDVSRYDIPVSPCTASLSFEKLQFPLTLRRWQPGDSFYPLGMKKKKKLSDFFIDGKFTLAEKEAAWLLCSGKDIAWIVGHRIDHRFRITRATREILCVLSGEA